MTAKRIMLCLLLKHACVLTMFSINIFSPDKNTEVIFQVEKGVPAYSVVFHSDTVIRKSPLGLNMTNGSFSKDLKLIATKENSIRDKWKTVWGEKETIINEYQELSLTLENGQKKRMSIIFRVFDKGIGFRYHLEGKGNEIITDELTQFNLGDDYTTYWIPACFENDEYHYQNTRLSEVSFDLFKKAAPKGHAKFHPCETGFNTPVTMKTDKGKYICIHEAAIWNYPGFSLYLNPETYETKTLLASKTEEKAHVTLPFSTPWRVIILGNEAKDLLESDLVLNLNEPCKLKDVSWIKPMKYIGIWWEMHLKKSEWKLIPGKIHGATTENTKKYIDFAAKYGFGGVLVEGWNHGWERGWKNFEFTGCYPDFDIKAITDYANKNGVQLIGHHETGSEVENYIRQMDEAYKFYQKYGVHAVKTGYVGKIKDHYHHDQWMVNHYNSTVTKGAEYHIAINIHEPIKPSGICRTYPNLLSGEGMRGQEQNAWSEGNDVNHNTILPFTRNMAGPMDFTPGIFDVRFLNSVNSAYNDLKSEEEKRNYEFKHRVRTTLSQQLALFVVFYSPIHMAADLLENYEGHPAFQFIVDVPVDWKDTKILEAEIGEYVVTARKDKASENWYLGAITNGTSRNFNLPLSFLDKSSDYEVTIYEDGKDANWETNPESYKIRKMKLKSTDILNLNLATGGGAAVSFKKTI